MLMALLDNQLLVESTVLFRKLREHTSPMEWMVIVHASAELNYGALACADCSKKLNCIFFPLCV